MLSKGVIDEMIEFKDKIIKESGVHIYRYAYDEICVDVEKIALCLLEFGVDIVDGAISGTDYCFSAYEHTLFRTFNNIEEMLSFVPNGEFCLESCQFRIKYLEHILDLVFDFDFDRIKVVTKEEKMEDFMQDFLEKILQALKNTMNDHL